MDTKKPLKFKITHAGVNESCLEIPGGQHTIESPELLTRPGNGQQSPIQLQQVGANNRSAIMFKPVLDKQWEEAVGTLIARYLGASVILSSTLREETSVGERVNATHSLVPLG